MVVYVVIIRLFIAPRRIFLRLLCHLLHHSDNTTYWLLKGSGFGPRSRVHE